MASARPKVEVPRELLKNPFSVAYKGLGLAERVFIAAEASARAGRRMGAIVLNPPANFADHASMLALQKDAIACGETHDTRVPAHAQATVLDQVVAHLRSKLRASDYVGLAEGNTIVVFVSLLKTRDDLLAIARRMQVEANAALRSSGLLHGVSGGSVWQPGIAIYPLDGYECFGPLPNGTAAVRRRALR